jgi:aryl-alcohol dehydrogenase-like predicted oxidoreductase
MMIETSRAEVTAPIVGTTSLEKLEDLLGAFPPELVLENDPMVSLGALDVKLTSEEIAYLEEPYKPMKIFMYN